MSNQKEKLDQTQLVSDDLVEDVIRHLMKLKGKDYMHYQYNEMMFEIIKFLKCDTGKASVIMNRMKEFGLELCFNSGFNEMTLSFYDFSRFSEMRDIKQN